MPAHRAQHANWGLRAFALKFYFVEALRGSGPVEADVGPAMI
jgi:hypothetical protein